MKKIASLILCGLLCLGASAQGPLTTNVTTEAGPIEGYQANGLMIYKGIPFAAPPVGELRWKAPQPVKHWTKTLETKKYAPGPIQGAPSAEYSEDCLYLNVWSPAKKTDEKLPVLVWIYGGGFVFGSTADPNYDCEELARKGGIILASVNYRVGQLGFLTLPELTAENDKHISGNYGLMDQIVALQWIKNNIARFGGDPNKVTIFGESAGGISVSMLCASPLAKGLFQGAISQSGGSFGPTRPTTYPGENMKTLADAEKDGTQVMQKLGAKSLAELRAMDASKFSAQGLGTCSWPVVDGCVIPDDQSVLYANGKYNDVPVLIGYNSDEGASFSFGNTSTKEGYESSTKTRYGKFADALIKAYPFTEEDGGKQSRDLMRDAAFGWQTWNWARLQTKTGKSKVFLYYFDQHPDHPKGSPDFGKGSYHGQDVNFVFQHMDKFERPDVDRPLSELMGKYWINFAKYGDPNGEGLPKWPVFSNDKPQTMHLTYPNPSATKVPSEEALKVLDTYFTWRRTAEGKAWAK